MSWGTYQYDLRSRDNIFGLLGTFVNSTFHVPSRLPNRFLSLGEDLRRPNLRSSSEQVDFVFGV
jgi:hypothetical protein